MVDRYILHNDDIRAASDQSLSPAQVGLLSGWGVFSTIRVFDGVLFAFERHYARMLRDSQRMRVPFPADPAYIEQRLQRLVEANDARNAAVRVVVVRNRGGIWEGPGIDREYDLIALTAPVREWGGSVSLGLIPNARYAACPLAGTKILSWSQNLVWADEAHSRGLHEVILLNERGEVSECTSANVFAAEGNQVWTPPLRSGCLAGVTREILLGELGTSQVRVGEKDLFPADLERADEVFITSTTRQLLSVHSIEGLRIRAGGAAREKLQTAFSAYVDRYIAGKTAAAVTRLTPAV